MKNKLTHFAIHIEKIERAKSFNDGVFDWGFNSYGQHDFLQIKADKTENGELIGALQSRKYSRAIVKNELFAWKSALDDYDKAIEIEPEFVNAVTNRGALMDENGDYKGALEDYRLALDISELDEEQTQMIYFNRVNKI